MPDGEKLISLNLVYSYPVRWGKFKVLRDLIQNFYDAVGRKHWSSRFRADWDKDVLVMTGKQVEFSHEWLLHIGASTKRGGNERYAGYFGEGFKIAALCAHRDHNWELSIGSKDWEIDVTTAPLMVDGQELTSLAYRMRTRPFSRHTSLRLWPCDWRDDAMFRAAHLGFFHADNPLFGECLWESETEAVYLRSEREKPEYFPCTYDDPGRGIVFAGFQALGSHQLPIVFCLHDYTFSDRERRDFYKMDVVKVVHKIARRLPPEPAFALLARLRSRWYDRPKKRYDFDSWHGIVATLIDRIARSRDLVEKWRDTYPGFLLSKRIPKRDIIALNRRAQAMDWFRDQKGYKLVTEAFGAFGYPTLEEACEKAGGFSRTRAPRDSEMLYIHKLEQAVDTLFGHFFLERPPCRIIHTDGVWRGMASCTRLPKPKISESGHKIRFRLEFIALKPRLLQKGMFGYALSTYLHESAHVYGGDRSAAFSSAMTELLETALRLSPAIEHFRSQWDQIAPESDL